MTKEISKTWNTGLPTVVNSRKTRWMNKINLSLVVAPFILKWGGGVAVLMGSAMSLYFSKTFSLTEILLIVTVELSVFYVMGSIICSCYRDFILSKLLNRLKKSGDIGREVWEIATEFIEDVNKGNSFLIEERLFRAIRAAGMLELNNILADLKKEDKPSPMLRWRIITWTEKFNDEINLIFPYDEKDSYRRQSGWWAQALLPNRLGGEWDVNIRQPILEALPFADPDEGARLSAFIAEAATVNERGMSDEDKKDFMALSNQAKKMADNILAAQTPLPIQNGKTSLDNSLNSLSNIRRILSEESAEALSVSAPVEHALVMSHRAEGRRLC